MYNIELPQNFASDFNEKCHQVALLVRKAESKYENENISTGELLPGVPVKFWFFKVYSLITSRLTRKLLKSYSVDNL